MNYFAGLPEDEGREQVTPDGDVPEMAEPLQIGSPPSPLLYDEDRPALSYFGVLKGKLSVSIYALLDDNPSHMDLRLCRVDKSTDEQSQNLRDLLAEVVYLFQGPSVEQAEHPLIGNSFGFYLVDHSRLAAMAEDHLSSKYPYGTYQHGLIAVPAMTLEFVVHGKINPVPHGSS